MRKTLGILLFAELFLAISAPSARAQTVTYDINFTNTIPADGPSPSSGSFEYNYLTGSFVRFTVVWDGLTFDLTSSANNPSITSGPPACIGAATGPAATLALMTQCDIANPATTSTYWHAINTNLPVPAPKIAVFGFVTVPLPTPSSGEAVFGKDLPGTGTGDAAEGPFTVSIVRPKVPYFGGGLGQIIHIVAGPVMVPPGVPVELNLGFVDINGNSVGPSRTVTVGAGETASLDLIVDQLVQQLGQRVEVRPVVEIADIGTAVGAAAGAPAGAAAPAPPPVELPEVTEVFDRLTGYGTVLVPAKTAFPPNPIFALQGLAGGQTIRLAVSAFPPNPCAGTLGFANKDGSPVGPSLQVNLQPGQAALLDLNSATLGLQEGQRIELQPVLSTTPSTAARPPVPSRCMANAEVFDNATGRTGTYQTGAKELPAVQ